MCPLIGADLAAGALLDVVIANSGSGGHCVLELLLRNLLQAHVRIVIGIVCPDACVAVCLQLNLDGVGILARLVVIGKTQRSLEVLNVVTKLVGHDIHLRQGGRSRRRIG